MSKTDEEKRKKKREDANHKDGRKKKHKIYLQTI
jgi:hypothetical protein